MRVKITDGIVTAVLQELIPIGNENARPRIKMTAEYITIHNTGNPGASAKANSNYVRNQNGYKSWHFTIDDKHIIQQLPIDEHGWHAGDGANGPGNRKSIGIEVCEVPWAEEVAVKFVAELLIALEMDISKVVPHKRWSGKNCPRLILPYWQKFINDIKREMEVFALAEVKRFKNIKEMPEWMQVYVRRWVDKGYIKGNDKGELDFSEDMVRVLIISERMINR